LSYIGQRPVVGRYIKLDQISSGFNGSNTSFSMAAGSQAVSPGTARNMLVSLGGVIQEPDTNFTVSGSTLTFTTAPVANTTFFAVIFGDMQSTGTPSDGTVLPASIASSGNFSFPQLTVTGTSSLGDDVTFTGANYNVVWDKSDNALEFADSAKALFGTGQDLQIYHDGTNSTIYNSTGLLNLQNDGDDINLYAADDITLFVQGSESAITCIGNGAVSLYYDNSKKFETTSGGVAITGGITTTTNSTFDGNYQTFTGANYNAFWDKAGNYFKFVDNAKAVFGSTQDLQIYHDGSNSYIKEDGTGSLLLWSTGTEIKLLGGSGAETLADFNVDGAVELYYDNDRVFYTETRGVRIGDNTKIFENAAHNTAIIQHADIHHAIIFRGSTNADGTTITNGNVTTFREYGNFVFRTGQINALERLIIESNGTSRFVNNNDSTNEEIAKFNPNGSVELYYDNSKKFETTSSGVSITGGITTSGASTINEDFTFVAANGEDLRFDKSDSALEFNDNFKCVFGNSSDLSIYHDGSHTYIDNVTGNLNIRGANNENAILYTANGSIQLFHDNSKKFETQSIGITVTGQVACDELDMADSTGAGNNRIKLGTGDDLQIYHDGGGSYIANSTGILRLQAKSGENSISLNPDGASELYYDNTKRIFTESAGGAISGTSRFLGQGNGTGANATEVHFNSDSGHFGIHFSGHGNTGNTYTAARMVINGTGGTYGTITYSTGGTGYNSQSSDSRSKKNIVEWTESELDNFKNLQPKLFHFDHNEDSDPKYKGYIAQDNIAAFPEAYPLVDDRYMFNPSGMVHYLMKAMQELVSKVEVLETEVAALKAA
jgi:hypothetical protein